MKRIGKYAVCGLIGRGGMGSVYKARLPHIDRTVALKLFDPHPHLVSLMGYDAVLSRFISEAARIASLRSPRIAEILDFDYDGERPFFTMEFYYHDLGSLIGESVRLELPTRILSLEKIIHYTRQLLEGIARMSRAGITHRDIKPGNLLISDQDQIKICDFGCSRMRGEKPDRSPNLLVGSPFYAAPEQQQDPDRVDQRADLYSAGVILHRLLTGLLPENSIHRPSLYHPDADNGWDNFVGKALEPDPDLRYGSADNMLHDLEKLDTAWREKKENLCLHVAGTTMENARYRERTQLRGAPLKAGAKSAPEIFGCNRLMQPFHYAEPRCLPGVSHTTVVDPVTGLLWQQSGSEDRLTWREAHDYVGHLDALRFADAGSWRLPTVNELLSILRSPVQGTMDCIAPDFDVRQKMLWSSDRKTFVSAWFVNMELGFAGSADFGCAFHVRAVTEHTAPLHQG